jgi:predicted peptidase
MRLNNFIDKMILKRILLIISVAFMFISHGCISFKKITGMPVGKQTDSITGNYWYAEYSKRSRLNYIITFPKQYEETNETFPLILFLHSQAERGTDINLLVKNENGDCLSPLALKDKQFSFITISPLCPKNIGWPFIDRRLNFLLKDVTKKYWINTSKIYLTGVSMGGMGVWSLAMDYPQWFAAIAPISGIIIFPMTIMKPKALKNIPIWAFHDRFDTTLSIKFEEGKIMRVIKAGGNVKYTISETGNHEIWKEIYAKPDIFNWFLGIEKRKLKNKKEK